MAFKVRNTTYTQAIRDPITRKHPMYWCKKGQRSNPVFAEKFNDTFKRAKCSMCNEWSDVLGKCWKGECANG